MLRARICGLVAFQSILLACTITGCDGGTDDKGEGEDEDKVPVLGTLSAAVSLGDTVDSTVAFDTLTVTLSGLGACDDRDVELRAVTPDGDGVLVGGALPTRVPTTGAEHTVTFTAAEVLAARGVPGTSRVEAVLRCADDEVDRSEVAIRNVAAVAGVSGLMAPTGERFDDGLVLDDGGLLMMSSTVDADDDTLVHVFLDAFDSTGARRGASRELGTLDALYYGSAQVTFPKDGPGIDRLGNNTYAVRLYDDQFTPLFASTAIVDSSGAVIRAWDRAVIQLDVVGDRIVLLHVPLATAHTDEPNNVVIDIVNATTGADIVTGIQTGLLSSELTGDQVRATIVAVDDDGVDVTVGGRTDAALLLARDGAAPVRVAFPRTNTDELITLAPLPGATDGRFIAAIGDELQTTFNIVTLNAAQDGFDFDTLITVEDQVLLGGVARSATQQSLAVVLGEGPSGSAHVVYFHDGALVCSMDTVVVGDTTPTVTDDAVVIAGSGRFVTSCDDERIIEGGFGSNPIETSAGLVEAYTEGFTDVRVLSWLPLDTLVEFSTPAVTE